MVWDISLNVHYSTYVSFTSISCIIYFEHEMQFIWKCMMHWFLYVVYYYYFDIQLIKTELLQWNSHYYTINISNFKYLHLVFYNSLSLIKYFCFIWIMFMTCYCKIDNVLLFIPICGKLLLSHWKWNSTETYDSYSLDCCIFSSLKSWEVNN